MEEIDSRETKNGGKENVRHFLSATGSHRKHKTFRFLSLICALVNKLKYLNKKQ